MKRLFAPLLIALQVSIHTSLAYAGTDEASGTSVSPATSQIAQSAPTTPVESAVAADLKKQKMNEFIANLMSKMTLEEKIGQMNLPSIGFDVTGPVVSKDVEDKIKNGLVGGVFNTFTPNAVRKLQEIAVNQSRLKIPLLFGFDVIHGHRTIFPIPLALSCSWDLDLIGKTASAAAKEASADGLNWTFSPMVDIARDPRWGRCSEGAGEDPYLGSRVAEAMVRGYQGENYDKADTILSCVKHFALYGAAEAGRDYNTVDMSKERMYNEYLPPYKAGVDAGAASVMSSFNDINGIPATANKWLITDVLRKQWGFSGFVATDYTAISEMIAHGMGDEKKVSELAFNAGIDMDMVSELFVKYGSELVKEGKVSETKINDACRRILEAKYKLGLFSDPFRFIDEKRNQAEIMSKDKLQLSQEAAVKSMVLLKNSNGLLPLTAAKKIAFIGPLVKDKRNLMGSWSAAGQWEKDISIWEVVKSKFGPGQVSFAKGCNLVDDPALIAKLNRDGGMLKLDERTGEELVREAVQAAKQSDVVVAVLGEPFCMSGEAASRSTIGLFDNQLALLKALKTTGKPIVLVLMNGRPLTLDWENANMDAILETWFAGTMAGPAIADVLYGDANPSGKLTMSFPINVGQIPIYYNQKNTGRPFDETQKYRSKYLDVSNAPLYPFGYGLSYSSFSFGDVHLSSPTLKPSEPLTVSTTMTNTSTRAGVETAQLYVRQFVGSITRPVKELKGFQKVELKPHETKTVSFTLNADDLRFWDGNLEHVLEPGAFEVFVGSSSKDVKEADFALQLH